MDNRELWPFLFIFGTLLLNWPFLDIFNLSLPIYLFGVWALFIAGVAFFVSRGPRRRKQKKIV